MVHGPKTIQGLYGAFPAASHLGWGTLSATLRCSFTSTPSDLQRATIAILSPVRKMSRCTFYTVFIFFVAACGHAPTAAPTQVPLIVSTTPIPSVVARPTPSLLASSSALSPTDWPTYHRDNTRTGYLPNLADPLRLTVLWTTALDGAVYAEPLVVGEHLIVATEGNSVYSLDVRAGQVEWRTNLGEPVPRSALPCGNINPLGITGTPVYDADTESVFAVAEVSGPAHLLVGINARTGDVQMRRSADPEGMLPAAQQQRAALALAHGMVYVAFGGLFGDCGSYHGWVIASRTDGSGALLAYQVPTQREGGIWAPSGPVIDNVGRLYVSVGNGSEVFGPWDHSDSVLRLSRTLTLEDGFAPEQWRQDNLTDADLGSLGPVLLPGDAIFIVGKSGVGYVLRSNSLGGVGGQVVAKPMCHAYGGAAVVGSTVFVPCNEGLQQVEVGPGARLTLGWQARQVPGSPVVGGHTIYSLDRSGTLHALDANTGQERAAVAVGATSRFATPTLFPNRVFIGTLTGVVAVSIR